MELGTRTMTRRPTSHIRLAAVAAFAAIASSVSANGAPISLWDPGTIPALLCYEAFVIVAEWLMLGWAFRLPWTRAFWLSVGANLASFIVGLPSSISLTPFFYWILLMLPVNVLTEGSLLRETGAIDPGRGYWGRIFAVNFVTWLAMLLFGPLVPKAAPRSAMSSDQRSVASAIEAYFVAYDAYPPASPLVRLAKQPRKLREAGGIALGAVPADLLTSGGIGSDSSFMSRPMPMDIYAPELLPYAYYETSGVAWILFSPGPDRKYDIIPAQDYDPHISQPSSALLLKSYDPTNGCLSRGDVFRVRQ
jgi:hypothetical protein